MAISAEEALAGVQSVIAAYAHAIDAGDADTVAGLFTEDGVSEIAGQGTFQGREAIREAYGAFKPQAPQLHLVGNTVLTSSPGEEVTATSNLVFFARGEEGWAVRLVGGYEDTVVLVDGAWQFRKRVTSFR
ncbi:nuclear transport factor 2 family protein [Streptomyces sp. NPDC047000]|uniref:nuclear transport factor 2 family protein n=1 Tax=Streptomyces sp. NPDC047000 TaxID=3155474 RepID=UPI0033FB13E4